MDLVAWGGLAIIAGVVAKGFVESRGFNRTNSAGVQVFSGYLHMKLCQIGEGLLGLVGTFLLFSGLILGMMGMPKHMKEARTAAAARAAIAASQPAQRKPSRGSSPSRAAVNLARKD